MPTAAEVFDVHMQAELRADLESTLATMVEEPHLLNLGSGSSGAGAAGMREFITSRLIDRSSRPMGSASRSRRRSTPSGGWTSW